MDAPSDSPGGVDSLLEYSDIHFVLVGPGKAATSWLAHCLREHPQLFVTLETNYLSNYRELGMDYWRNRFAGRERASRLGEYSAWYFSSSDVPEALASLNPALKIIVSVRDPVAARPASYTTDDRGGYTAAIVAACTSAGRRRLGGSCERGRSLREQQARGQSSDVERPQRPRLWRRLPPCPVA